MRQRGPGTVVVVDLPLVVVDAVLLFLFLVVVVLVEGEHAAQNAFPPLFRLFLVFQPPPGDLVLRAGPVPVAEAVPEGGGDLFTPERLVDLRVPVAIVPQEGDVGSLLPAGGLDLEVDVRDDRRLDDSAGRAGVFPEAIPDHRPELVVSGSLLGDASLSDNDRALGGKQHIRGGGGGGRRCDNRERLLSGSLQRPRGVYQQQTVVVAVVLLHTEEGGFGVIVEIIHRESVVIQW